MELQLILTELQPFELSHFKQFLHCRVLGCLINFSHSSMNVSETLQTYCYILKICMWVSGRAKINFDRIYYSLLNLVFWQLFLHYRISSVTPTVLKDSLHTL